MPNHKKNIISVIIVNYNGGNKIIESVRSVLRQNYQNFKIIVIDNGSTDNSINEIEKICSPKVQVYKLNKNYGFTYGCNLGIKKSKGKYFMLLNNDAYLQNKNFIKKTLNILENSNNKTIGIFPKVVFNWENNVINSSFVVWHHRQLWYDKNIGTLDNKINSSQKVFGAMFIAPVFKRLLWNKIGCFDNSFFTYGEDFDICYRANILGYNFIYSPGLVVKHDFRSSSKESVNPLWSYFYFQRNYLYVILKNYQFLNLIKHFKAYTVFFRSSFISGLKNRNIKLIKLHIKVVIDIFKNLQELYKKRKIIQNQRLINDSQIWNYDFATPYNPYFYENKIVISLDSINIVL